MKPFEVEIDGQVYDVDAPDERTAWAWANRTHSQYKQGLSNDVSKLMERGAIGRAGSGARATVQNAFYGVKDLFTDLSPKERRQIDVNKQFLNNEENTAGRVGGFAADVASFALPGGIAAKGIAKGVSMLPRAAQLAAGVGANAALDAGLSAAYSTGDRAEAAQSGLLGSLGGQAAGKVLARTLGGVVKPSEAGRRMMDQGVQPTIGQAADQGKWTGRTVRSIEERAQSIPIIGDIISKSRNRAVEEGMRGSTRYSNEAINAYRNVPGVNPLPPKAVGNELLKVVNENASAVYNNALSKAGNIQVKGELPSIGDVNLSQLAFAEAGSRGVDDAALQRFIDTTVKPKIQGGTIDGDSWKLIDSKLGQLAAQFRNSADGDKRLLGDTYQQLQIFWREWLEKSVDPAISKQVSAANAAWAKMLPLEKAAASAGARRKAGTFSGEQLQSAVAALDKSRFDRASRYNPNDVARYANDAAEVLGNTVPDSGTAGRLLLGAGATGFALPFGAVPELALAAGLTGSAYSRPAQKALLGGYSKQKALEEALRRRNAYFGDVGAAASGE
jgi:hypothetical protein